MADQYETRPSQLLGIADPYTAFCLDEAIYMWGSYVDSELDKVGDRDMDRKARAKMEKLRAARQQRYEQLMTEPTHTNGHALVVGPTTRFRDPMALFNKSEQS